MQKNSKDTQPRRTMFAALAQAGGSVAAAVGDKGRRLFDRISGRYPSSEPSDTEEAPEFDLQAYKTPVQSGQQTQKPVVTQPPTALKDRSQPD